MDAVTTRFSVVIREERSNGTMVVTTIAPVGRGWGETTVEAVSDTAHTVIDKVVERRR